MRMALFSMFSSWLVLVVLVLFWKARIRQAYSMTKRMIDEKMGFYACSLEQ